MVAALLTWLLYAATWKSLNELASNLGHIFRSINTCLISWSSQLQRVKVCPSPPSCLLTFLSGIHYLWAWWMVAFFLCLFPKEPFILSQSGRRKVRTFPSFFSFSMTLPNPFFLCLFVSKAVHVVLRINLSLWLMGNCFRLKGQPSKPFSPQGMQMTISVIFFPALAAPQKNPRCLELYCTWILNVAFVTPGLLLEEECSMFTVHSRTPHPNTITPDHNSPSPSSIIIQPALSAPFFKSIVPQLNSINSPLPFFPLYARL